VKSKLARGAYAHVRKIVTQPALTAICLILLLNALISGEGHARPQKIDYARPEATYTVSGQVRGPDGPLENVQLFLDCCSNEGFVSTDANGEYTFTTDGATQGSLIVFPSLQSQLGQAARYISIDADTDDVNFSLAPGNLLAGRVVNQNGYPAKFDHDLYNSLDTKQWLSFNEYAEFMLYLPPDQYRLTIGPPGEQWEDFTVDLSEGDVSFWEVTIDVDDEDLPATPDLNAEGIPPQTSLIQVSTPDPGTGIVQISGSAGAVAEDIPYLDIINLHTGSFVTADVATDRSFTAQILAPYGSALQLRNNWGVNEYLRWSDTGTILWVFPDDMSPQPGGEIPVYAAGRAGDHRGYWTASGTINADSYLPGDSFTAALNVMITAPKVDASFDASGYTLQAVINFERFFEQDGTHHALVQRGSSTSFTPTGLPIDSMSNGRNAFYTPVTIRQTRAHDSREGNVLHFDLDLTGTLPDDLPAGIYRPALVLTYGPDGSRKRLNSNILLGDDNLDDRAELSYDENIFPAYLPVVRVGNPTAPRLPWALLVNTFSNGLRGTVAIEERDLLGLSNRHAFQSKRFVIQPTNRFGQQISYRLEPFIPTISSSVASDVEPHPPIIPLEFPGGQLRIQVTKPDGGTEDLGTHTFQQARNSLKSERYYYYIGPDREPQKIYEVTTLSDDFHYQFETYGRYLISMTGNVQDVWGNSYAGGGTYEVWVAEPLDLEPAVFPGQPLEVGDPLATGVIVHPPISATVALTYTLIPSTGIPSSYSVTGTANRFGYFQPADEPFVMPWAGEYLLDITAEYWDDQGVLWAGSSRGAGVVETPNSDFIAHGLRGITQFTDVRPQWFHTSDIHPSGLKENTPATPEDDGFMMLYPYHTGDILWVPDRSNSIIADLSVDDQDGWYGDILDTRYRQVPWVNRTGQPIDERTTIGELPLVTTTYKDYEWSLFPEFVDQWGYAYLSTQRPGVSVRSYVATDNLFRTYWSTDYKYDRQLGNGSQGDLENDIKLQFGGAVIRYGEHMDYLGYASMEVLIPLGDPLGTRTFPPFQGATGGPSGGPILTLKGEDVDLFLTPTGLRPGSILEVGDTVAIAGTMWPTLNSKGTFVITAPSKEVHTISGQANKFGYFYAADGNFQVDEPGVWKVEASLLHDQVVPSTGGDPPEINNTGDLLGARTCDGKTDPVGCGQFYFYVVETDTPALVLDVPREFHFPGSIPITIEGDFPSGWSDVSGKFTAVMSGFILEEGDLSFENGSFTYQFNPFDLHGNFPNLDIITPDGKGEMADTFTFSFMLSGEDAKGSEQHRACSAVLQGQWLQALPQSKSGGGNMIFLPMMVR
jgi:hypothetical protein